MGACCNLELSFAKGEVRSIEEAVDSTGFGRDPGSGSGCTARLTV